MPSAEAHPWLGRTPTLAAHPTPLPRQPQTRRHCEQQAPNHRRRKETASMFTRREKTCQARTWAPGEQAEEPAQQEEEHRPRARDAQGQAALVRTSDRGEFGWASGRRSEDVVTPGTPTRRGLSDTTPSLPARQRCRTPCASVDRCSPCERRETQKSRHYYYPVRSLLPLYHDVSSCQSQRSHSR